MLLCRESTGSYDTSPYWSVCSLDDVMRALSPDHLLVSCIYTATHTKEPNYFFVCNFVKTTTDFDAVITVRFKYEQHMW